MSRSYPVRACLGCGRQAQIRARGWCNACYKRWFGHGKPASGPPAPLRRDPGGRRRDLRVLMSAGVTDSGVLAGRLGVSRVQVDAYKRQLAGRAPASCGCARRPYAFGWCKVCYNRWHRAGKPESGPPADRRRELKASVARYRELTAAGVTLIADLERAMGISRRTVLRYRALAKTADAEADRVMALLYGNAA